MKKKVKDNPNLIKDVETGLVVTNISGGLDAARKAKQIALNKIHDHEILLKLLDKIDFLEKRITKLEKKHDYDT